MNKRAMYISLCITLVALFVLWASSADAYPSYTGCSECHPGFIGGPGAPLHNLHVSDMTGVCLLCHTQVGDTPFTNDSGDPNGEGCTGCHGVNPDPGGPPNNLWGAGLRLHHANAGVPPDADGLICADCHTSDPVPPTEDTVPVYYTRDDVNVKDPCVAQPAPPGEDFSGDGAGLDNDGDLVSDGNDPDCQQPAVCGNGVVDAGEECDDGNTMPGDCCSSTCTFEPAGSTCADGLFCNGEETCDGAGVCQAGTPVDCDDGVGCTVDSCDEANNMCVNAPDNALCTDDGLFCNGEEVCDPIQDCVSAGDPCPAGTTCNETTDTCEAQVEGRVTICHIPPGNPGNARTFVVNSSSLKAHLEHGDTLGECPLGGD